MYRMYPRLFNTYELCTILKLTKFHIVLEFVQRIQGPWLLKHQNIYSTTCSLRQNSVSSVYCRPEIFILKLP